MPSARIGYLVSRYPAISHTFILREVTELKNLGFLIEVASINGEDRPWNALTEIERKENELCFYVKSAARGRLAKDLVVTLCESPVTFLKAVTMATRANGPDLRRIAKNLFYLLEAVLVSQWIKRLNLGHLHVHFATPAATVGLLAAELAGVGFSMTVHGPDEFYDVDGYLLPCKCAKAQFVCAISNFAGSQLMRLMARDHWRKIKVLPLGIDAGIFTPYGSVRPDGRQFKLLCVGRLVPEKGHHILLTAVSLLLGRGKNVGLTLVGDGPSGRSLRKFVEHNGLGAAVTFAGAINQDQIRPLYASADAFVLASFAEGVPVVLMEAMAMQIPCVATWIAGIPELIREGRDGLLVAPGSADDLADAIARLMDDDQLRCSLGRAGRLRVIDKYDLKSNVAALGRVFDAELGRAA
jgi:colanic acid/amylovoran biosynthesis glycosyltransferase